MNPVAVAAAPIEVSAAVVVQGLLRPPGFARPALAAGHIVEVVAVACCGMLEHGIHEAALILRDLASPLVPVMAVCRRGRRGLWRPENPQGGISRLRLGR